MPLLCSSVSCSIGIPIFTAPLQLRAGQLHVHGLALEGRAPRHRFQLLPAGAESRGCAHAPQLGHFGGDADKREKKSMKLLFAVDISNAISRSGDPTRVIASRESMICAVYGF